MLVGVVSDASATLERSDYEEDFIERQRKILREEEFVSLDEAQLPGSRKAKDWLKEHGEIPEESF